MFRFQRIHTKFSLVKAVCVIALSSLLLSCAHRKDTDVPTSAENEMAAVNRAVPPASASATAERVTDDLLKQSMENAASNNIDNQRFDISVQNIPAKAFFLGLVNGTSSNLVVHPEVDGVISLELKSVNVNEVLHITRDVFGYEFSERNGIYTIYPRKLRTQVFPINYIDVQREGMSDTSIMVGNVTSSSNNNNSSSGSGSNNSSNNNRQEVSAGARIRTKSDANFWESLKISLNAIVGVGSSDGQESLDRMVMVNPQTGMVIVRALPAELTSVRDFLIQSQLSAARQVILETKIIEVKLNDGFESGIDWTSIQGGLAGAYDVLNSTATIPERVVESGFTAALAIPDIQAFIKFLETQGHVQVLSSPRVSTVNNQKAIIRVGTDEYFVTGISNSTTSSAATTTTTPNIDLASFFSGIALDVTPQIAENGDVILHVHPVISDVTDQQKEFTVGDEKFSLPLALRDIRESDSIVRAKNGQVIVLGGLMQELSREEIAMWPWLGKVPGLNVFFRKDSDQIRKTELVILMRPLVVDDDVWDSEVKRATDRINATGNEYRKKF